MKAGKKGKGKLEEIQRKDWAELTGSSLIVAAIVVSVILPPVGSSKEHFLWGSCPELCPQEYQDLDRKVPQRSDLPL